jgi:hypothetical protein
MVDFETWWKNEGRYIRCGGVVTNAKELAELAYKTGYADAVRDGVARHDPLSTLEQRVAILEHRMDGKWIGATS